MIHDAILVAVYGTLKRGMSNHRLLEAAEYLGSDELACITLYDLGDYPAARVEPSDGIRIEVYEVSSAHMDALDQLEGRDALNSESGLYKRSLCQTRYGDAWIYIYNHSIDGMKRIGSGSWSPS